MKVIVVFNRLRQLFTNVEEMNFADFKEAVAAAFGLSSHDINIFLGENLISLQESGHLSDFGIVSGDLLHVKMKQERQNQAGPSTSHREPLENRAENIMETDDISLRTCKDELLEDEDLEDYVVQIVTDNMKRSKFNVNERRSFSSSDDSPAPRLDLIHLKCVHSDFSSISLEFTLNLFRDGENNPDVTSVSVQATAVANQSREHIELIFINRETIGIPSLLVDRMLTPIKERVLGPDNPFLRALSKNLIVDVFRFLKPRDVLSVEQTCRFAYWKCRSSRLIDDKVWKHYLEADYSVDAVPDRRPTYPHTFRQLYRERHANARRLHQERERINRALNDQMFIPLPENPFSVLPRGWHHPYFPRSGEPPARSDEQPGPQPLDPFQGGLLLPSRPQRPHGEPTVYPRQPFWDDPLQRSPNNPPDPDMPMGPDLRPRGVGPFHPELPPRRGDGRNGRDFGFGGGFGGGIG